MTGGATAWLFPGQGTDLGGLPGEALAPGGRSGGAVRRLLEVAGQTVNIDLIGALRAGDPAVWRTEIAQPALVAATLGMAHEREGEWPAAGEAADSVVAAGHSLGELTAIAFAGCSSPEEAIRAAAERGRLMADAAHAAPGGMAALRCATRDELDQLLARVRHQGVLEVAAHNAPTQWVVSGERAALGAVLGIAGGVMLPVAGHWHSSAMAGAAAAWERSLRELDWRPARRRLALAGSATFATASTDLAATLARHLTRPVRWQETIEALLASGVAHLVAIGPGRVLRGLCREIAAGWMRERALAGDGVGLDGARAPVSVT